MKRVRWWIRPGFEDVLREGEWEVEDDTTDAELEAWLQEELSDLFDFGFERLDND